MGNLAVIDRARHEQFSGNDLAAHLRGPAKTKDTTPEGLSVRRVYAVNLAMGRSGDNHLSKAEGIARQRLRRIGGRRNGGARGGIRACHESPHEVDGVLREILRQELGSSLPPKTQGPAHLCVGKLPAETRPKVLLLDAGVRGDLPFGQLDELGDTNIGEALFARPLMLVVLPELDSSRAGSQEQP